MIINSFGFLKLLLLSSTTILADYSGVEFPPCLPKPPTQNVSEPIELPITTNNVDEETLSFCEYWRQQDGLQKGGVFTNSSVSAEPPHRERPVYKQADVDELTCYRAENGSLVVSILDKNFNECDENPTESVALKTAFYWIQLTATPIKVTAINWTYNTEKTVIFTNESALVKGAKERLQFVYQCENPKGTDVCNDLRKEAYESMLPESNAAKMLKLLID